MPYKQLTTLKAFSSAEGYGKNSTGGRGGNVYKVINLNNSGAGSFRQALADKGTSAGYIFFEVAGTITLTSTLSIPANTYIAGQTAFRNGGQGITLRQNESYDGALLGSSSSNIIIRYLRGRRGAGVPNEYNGDCITFTGGNNIMVDHCSLSWGTDEIFNVWGNAEYLTLQYSIISEALHNSTNIEGAHSKGALFGSGSDLTSIYMNYFAHNLDRNPVIGGSSPFPRRDFELANNIIHNSGFFGIKFGDSNGGFRVNLENNRLQRGSNTSSGRYQMAANTQAGNLFYVSGNIDDLHRTSPSDDEWDIMGCESCGTYMSTPLPTTFQALTPFSHPLQEIELLSIAELETVGITKMGANLYEDSVDIRVKEDFIDDTGSYIDDPSDVGGWPTISNMSSVPTDTNNDGIPDDFTSTHGITSTDEVIDEWDFGTYTLINDAGYTAIEIYLMSLANDFDNLELIEDGNIFHSLTTNEIKRNKLTKRNKILI